MNEWFQIFTSPVQVEAVMTYKLFNNERKWYKKTQVYSKSTETSA